jgi:hypothetical protein
MVSDRMKGIMSHPILGMTAEEMFYPDVICDQVVEYWRLGFIENRVTPFNISTTGHEIRTTQVNAYDVFRSEIRYHEQTESAVNFIHELIYRSSPEAVVFFDKFRHLQEKRVQVSQRLTEFQTNQLLPIKTTFEDVGDVEGKCSNCPTLFKLVRKTFL